MTNEELDAIYERVNAATPGPWVIKVVPNRIATEDEATMDEWGTDTIVGDYESDDDAEFIAAARTDIPALLAEVNRLRNELQSRMVLGGEFDQ